MPRRRWSPSPQPPRRPRFLHAAPQATASSALVGDIAATRLATAKYVNDLALAKKNGYMIITKMIPTMGYHFMNPNVKGFDVRKPPILVYEHHGKSWQLGAVEWVFTVEAGAPPAPRGDVRHVRRRLPLRRRHLRAGGGAGRCPAKAPGSGAKFTFWHPQLVTLHLWLWYPNPSGLFASTNPLVTPFNHG